MKILLSGYYGFNNIGDEAILYSIIQALRYYDPTIEITVLSNNTVSTSKEYDVKAVNRWSVKEIFLALLESDGLISGGGSLLQDQTGWKSVPYYTSVMYLANLLRKPVFVYAQGMGPINKSVNKWVVQKVLKRVNRITVRDQRSKDLLVNLKVRKEIDLVPDPVLGLSPSEQETDTWLNQQEISNKIITVSVRNWTSDYNYLKKIALALDQCIQQGYEIIFIPMHGKHDDITSKKVANMMHSTSLIAPFDASIHEKIEMIGRSKLLVGMRLHALIFASITNTPFISLSYDPKIDSFTEQANQKLAGHVRENNWNEHTLYQQIIELLNQESEYKQKLHSAVTPLKNNARYTAKEAINLFSPSVRVPYKIKKSEN
ncbi:polysaccharide pyruvyl transferase CsaB [Bacillus suaedaesalsae]|uniref:Polysaccharide pyruvyl transferase CsaB n=1 Tax=Bacillus suaedaesalsae TaxID=2810349 RepID=A0ABS2DKQ9_9BACI|nr:polysaccharide pyruvyl transferase CsaB [Bacillus suaedaesalsae]MBM6619075.1 polysaccharide pyruvyl transferase CsaB [Bacillus suaedaesalsae]